ncbi:hypothetical protein P7K49_039765, partial [Saguinus oedipus]
MPLNKRIAEQIEGYVAALNKGTVEQTFTAISLYAGILLKRPLNKRKAEQIEGCVASKVFPEFPFNTRVYLSKLNAHIDIRSLNKRKAEQIEGYVALVFKAEFLCYFLNKRKAEQIEGYVASVFKAEFLCYF